MKPWVLTEDDFLTAAEVRAFRDLLEAEAEVAPKRRRSLPIRDWALFDVAMSAGLRASELCDLNVGDLAMKPGQSSLVVRRGKGGRTRAVAMPVALRRHLKAYVAAKRKHGEPVDDGAPLFLGRRGRITRTAVHVRFKVWAKKAGLPSRYSVHSLRHTYATNLLKACDYNLPLVRQQLGHSSVTVTEVYTHVIPQDLDVAVNALYPKKAGSPPP